METQSTPKLSPKALAELRAITKNEIAEPMTDAEIEEMGVRLLRLFSILSIPKSKPPGLQPTEQEQRAIAFIAAQIQKGKSPSIRELTLAMGFRSSRSGFRLLDRLVRRGFVTRCEPTILKLTESATPTR